MNIAPDPKSIPQGTLLSPEANQAATLATTTGVLTVDLDAIVANWRKLEKTAVPAECAGVVKANAYGCGTEPVARALAAAACKTLFVATLDEAAAVRAAVPPATIYALDRLFPNSGEPYGMFLGAQLQFDLVRPGAALYGVSPTPEADNPMQLVVELKARIVQFRNIERGEAVGYGGTWTARRPTRLAIVSAGYADGYFRAASANDGTRGAEVVVAGKRCPIAGRVSMDLIAVDVTDLEKNAARRRHMVTLLGEGITVDELAHHFGTIGYEALTSLGPRYARVYKGGGTTSIEPAPATSA